MPKPQKPTDKKEETAKTPTSKAAEHDSHSETKHDATSKSADAEAQHGIENDAFQLEPILETIAAHLSMKDIQTLGRTARFFNKKLAPHEKNDESKDLGDVIWMQKYILFKITNHCFTHLHNPILYLPPSREYSKPFSYMKRHDPDFKNSDTDSASDSDTDFDPENAWFFIANGDFSPLGSTDQQTFRNKMLTPFHHNQMLIEHIALLRMIFANKTQFSLDSIFDTLIPQEKRYQAILDDFYNHHIKNNETYKISSPTEIGIDEYGRTLLHWAIICHQPLDSELLQPLVNNNILKIQDRPDRNTALHLATIYGSDIELLIKNGAAINMPNNTGATPLHLAAALNLVAICDSLINHRADVNAANDVGISILSIAAAKRNYLLCKLLLQNGANPSTTHRPPLILSVQGQASDVAKLLIEKGANVNAIDPYLGDTALHQAASCGNVDVCKLLIEKGANVNSKNYSSDSPLHIAAKANFPDVCKLLIERHADVNQLNDEGITPLRVAQLKSNDKCIELLKDLTTSRSIQRRI